MNDFFRYENGKIKPPLASVVMLKVRDRHPELLDEIKAA
ncbi:MAG: type II toxin-antitoxin system MqsA family antitoxin [Terracidiphilus sp.]